MSDDALTITWHLREGMKWHDGEALDAEDVKYTFDYVKEHPETYFSSSMSIVDSIEIIDPLTVAGESLSSAHLTPKGLWDFSI